MKTIVKERIMRLIRENCSEELDVIRKKCKKEMDNYIIEIEQALKKQDKLLAAFGIYFSDIETEQ